MVSGQVTSGAGNPVAQGDADMTIKKAHSLVKKAKDAVGFEHRFARDTGTILRLVGGAMVNVFDDGRYYIQGENTAQLMAVFEKVEAPWDPNAWDGSPPVQPD